MENQHDYRQKHHQVNEKKSGGSFLGTILIVIGLLWILKEVGWHLSLPGWHAIQHSASSFLNIFHVAAWSVTWPLVLLIVGVLLVLGRRFIGALLIVGALFLFLPHFIIPGILVILFFPVLLVVLGIILISKLF